MYVANIAVMEIRDGEAVDYIHDGPIYRRNHPAENAAICDVCRKSAEEWFAICADLFPNAIDPAVISDTNSWYEVEFQVWDKDGYDTVFFENESVRSTWGD